MARIQNVGVGKYIRNPKGMRPNSSSGIETLQIASNEGNNFLCYPVVSSESGRVVVDTTRYLHIPIDTDVQQVTI